MPSIKLHRTTGVKVGHVQIGGGAPVVVQSMTITDTADAIATATQCVELSEAGSELVRVTVNTPAAAAAVPEIKQRMQDLGCDTPLIGDFHYNGHQLLSRYPGCAAALAMPSNVAGVPATTGFSNFSRRSTTKAKTRAVSFCAFNTESSPLSSSDPSAGIPVLSFRPARGVPTVGDCT